MSTSNPADTDTIPVPVGIHPNYFRLTTHQRRELHTHARQLIEELDGDQEALETCIISMSLASARTVEIAAAKLADAHIECDTLRDRVRKTYMECAGAIALAAAILVIPIIW